MVESSRCPRNPIMPLFSLRLTVPNLVIYKDMFVTQRRVLVAGLLIDRRVKVALHNDGHCRQRECAPSVSRGCLLYALCCSLSYHFYLSSMVLNLSAYLWRL